MLRAMAYPRTCLRLAWLTAATFAFGACGDDGSSEGSGDGSAASTSTTSPGTDTGPATSASSTDPDPTIASASASGDTTSTGGGSTSTTSGVDSSSGGSESGAVDCSVLDETACMDEPACMPIAGQPIVSGAEGSCLDAREFLECQPMMACGEALTYACAGDDAPLYQFPTTCIPSTFMDCGPPPPVDLPPC